MSIQRLTPDDFETFTLETNPRRFYASSSLAGVGVTGSVNLFARRSTIQKEIMPLSLFSASAFTDHNIEESRKDVLRATGSTNILANVSAYMDAVNLQQSSVRLQQQLEVIRFTPPFSLNSDTLRKGIVINKLMPYYRTSYPRAQFNYANYHCLNFFVTGATTNSALFYPNPIRTDHATLTDYGFSGSFTFDFWIKPKQTTSGPATAANSYSPGTIIHLTGAYALTLCTGSSKDINGCPDAFKLLLQLSNSCGTAPFKAVNGPLSFFSNDNILPINEWSHVTVRWGGTNYNNGTGSFTVNTVPQGEFVISTSLNVGDQAEGDPSVLVVGAYYSGFNTGIWALTKFFTTDTATREGLYELEAGTGNMPANWGATPGVLQHPLRAELHEIKLYDRRLTDTEVSELNTHGPKSIDPNLRFYLPPFFTEESPYRTFYNGSGGVLTTPFFEKDGTTKHPFSVEMAFGCGGHYINLENYTRDFATGRYPRLWCLSGSAPNTTMATPLAANTILYSTASVSKRLYMMLPNDNGRFYPNFDLLRSLGGTTFRSDLGAYEPGVISLRNMLTATYVSDGLAQFTGSNAITDHMFGGNSPTNYGTTPGDSLAIYHRTRDNTSNQIVLFDISNMFYGNQIKPGTFVMRDSALSSSGGRVSITLKDDGLGNLYRADVAQAEHATWASVGNIFYNEGIVLLKSPQLFFFGTTQFNVEFQGVQNIHVLSVNAFARPMQLITSSKPGYMTGAIGDTLANVNDPNYVFISTVYLHDDNMNVISRTNIAQLVQKRSSDKYLFKIKMDY